MMTRYPTGHTLRLPELAPECGHAYFDEEDGTLHKCVLKGPHPVHADNTATWSVRLLSVTDEMVRLLRIARAARLREAFIVHFRELRLRNARERGEST